MGLLERVQVRLAGEPKTDQTEQLQELCDLASVRICLRVREPTLSDLLEPIAADAVVKLWRRGEFVGGSSEKWNYEGISSENGDTISTSFVEDVLAEYDDEFAAYAEQQDKTNGKKQIHFY